MKALQAQGAMVNPNSMGMDNPMYAAYYQQYLMSMDPNYASMYQQMMSQQQGQGQAQGEAGNQTRKLLFIFLVSVLSTEGEGGQFDPNALMQQSYQMMMAMNMAQSKYTSLSYLTPIKPELEAEEKVSSSSNNRQT